MHARFATMVHLPDSPFVIFFVSMYQVIRQHQQASQRGDECLVRALFHLLEWYMHARAPPRAPRPVLAQPVRTVAAMQEARNRARRHAHACWHPPPHLLHRCFDLHAPV